MSQVSRGIYPTSHHDEHPLYRRKGNNFKPQLMQIRYISVYYLEYFEAVYTMDIQLWEGLVKLKTAAYNVNFYHNGATI